MPYWLVNQRPLTGAPIDPLKPIETRHVMKLTRCQPDASSFYAQSPFDGLFRHSPAGLPSFERLFDLASLPGTKSRRPAALAVDVYEDDGHYHAQFEVPGVKKEDVKIELEDRRLAVTASRKTSTAEGESTIELSRALTVPEGIDVENISAKLENGLLTVTLPKAAAHKPRVIELN